MITSQTVLSSDLLPLIQRHVGLLTPSEAVSLFLMVERCKGEKSDWWPYINLLPTEYSAPISFYPNFNAAILPPSCRRLYESQVREVEISYEKLKRFCKSEMAELPIDLSLFLWAFNTVNSRCVYKENRLSPLLNTSDGDSIAVMPLVDMFNHSPTAVVEGRFDSKTRTFSLRSNNSYMPGQQIFICYGGHNNARLFIEYGFTLADNPSNSYKLDIEELGRLCNLIGHRLTETHLTALRNFKCSCVIYATDVEASWNLLTTFLLISMDPTELSDWKCFDARRPPGFSRTKLYDIATGCLEMLLKEVVAANRSTKKPDQMDSWRWDFVTHLWQDDIDMIQLGLSQLQQSRLENCSR